MILKEILGKGAIYGLGSSLNGLISFILIPFYLGYLSAEEYGVFALAEMVLVLTLIVSGLGINIGLITQYYKAKSSMEKLLMLRSLLGFVLLSSTAISIGMSLFLKLDPGGLFTLSNEFIVLIALITICETVWVMFATLYRAEGAALRYVSASFLQAGVGLLVTVMLIAHLGFKEEGILYGRLVGNVILLIFISGKLFKYRPILNIKPALCVIRTGIPLVPATVSSMWIAMSPRFFIEYVDGTHAVGVFSMSAKIANLVSILFVQPFALVWVVVIHKIHRLHDGERIYSLVVTYYILVGGLIFLSLSGVAPQLSNMLSTDDFPVSPDVMMAMAIAYILSGLAYAVNIGPYIKDVTYRVLPAYLLSAVMVFLLQPVLISLWGIFGASIAAICIYLILSGLLMKISLGLYPMDIEWERIFKVLFSLISSYFISAYVARFDLGWFILGLPFFSIIVAILILVVIRFPSKREIVFIKANLSLGRQSGIV